MLTVHPQGYDVKKESEELLDALTEPVSARSNILDPTGGKKMEHEPVDVLIIGAGASGAAIAWSLLETRMRICV